MRNAWIGRHLGDVSRTFSKMVVTAADIASLLRTVEEDETPCARCVPYGRRVYCSNRGLDRGEGLIDCTPALIREV